MTLISTIAVNNGVTTKRVIESCRRNAITPALVTTNLSGPDTTTTTNDIVAKEKLARPDNKRH